MNRLIDVDELATYLKLEKQTIYNWLHEKKISGIKVGGVWRFDKKTIDEWLRANIVEAKVERENNNSRYNKKKRL